MLGLYSFPFKTILAQCLVSLGGDCKSHLVSQLRRSYKAIKIFLSLLSFDDYYHAVAATGAGPASIIYKGTREHSGSHSPNAELELELQS